MLPCPATAPVATPPPGRSVDDAGAGPGGAAASSNSPAAYPDGWPVDQRFASRLGQRLVGAGPGEPIHLQVLRAARLLESEKAGTHVTYRIAGDDVCALLQAVRLLAESRLAEIERVTRSFFEEREAMEPIDSSALVTRMRAGSVTLVDVRPREEYRAGHVPDAVSVPLDELERRIDEIPRDREIVAYCRAPYCVLALEAVEVLRSRGFEAVRMEDGVRDWRAMGLDLEIEGASS